MISVQDAKKHLAELVQPVNIETISLTQAGGRVLAENARATRDQPPFSASIMDGYAISNPAPKAGDTWTVIGEAAAGHRFDETVQDGQAVRIFTGAPLPKGAQRVIIQEDVSRRADEITLNTGFDKKLYVRRQGADFTIGDYLKAPQKLSPADVALLAAMNCAAVRVYRKPVIALIATGDELVEVGEKPRADQIIASNSLGLRVMFEAAGADVRMLPIARDTETALAQALNFAKDADLIITIGGASVGDHDLVAPVAKSLGFQENFYKIAMRPGKPLMAGKLGKSVLVALPGNPVSSMVCGKIFVEPLIGALQGLPVEHAATRTANLTHDLPANGPRAHYMRATVQGGEIATADSQDSALLSVLAAANALLVRPVKDAPRTPGDRVEYIPL